MLRFLRFFLIVSGFGVKAWCPTWDGRDTTEDFWKMLVNWTDTSHFTSLFSQNVCEWSSTILDVLNGFFSPSFFTRCTSYNHASPQAKNIQQTKFKLNATFTRVTSAEEWIFLTARSMHATGVSDQLGCRGQKTYGWTDKRKMTLQVSPATLGSQSCPGIDCQHWSGQESVDTVATQKDWPSTRSLQLILTKAACRSWFLCRMCRVSLSRYAVMRIE